MKITVLGKGCRNCERLEANARTALAGLGQQAEIAHERDPAEIAAWGVMRTPGLAIDDELVVAGRVPDAQEIERLIAERRAAGARPAARAAPRQPGPAS